jgi:hypothetical protein
MSTAEIIYMVIESALVIIGTITTALMLGLAIGWSYQGYRKRQGFK